MNRYVAIAQRVVEAELARQPSALVPSVSEPLPSTTVTEVVQPSPEVFTAPAACSVCGEVTLPFLLLRSEGTRAVLCPRGHWTPAREEKAR